MALKKHTSAADPASPAFGILSTAVMGALPLIDPSTLDGTQRRLLHAATAAATGLYAACTVNPTNTAGAPLKGVTGLAAAALALRFAETGDALDARLMRALRSGGVKHPRRWMAAVTAILTFTGFLADRAAARKENYDAAFGQDPARVRPDPSQVTYVLETPDGETVPLGQ